MPTSSRSSPFMRLPMVMYDFRLPAWKRCRAHYCTTTNVYCFYDGYLNDNLNSFSVRLKSSEIWIYTNGDSTDAHSLHLSLTSGYASPLSNYNSPGSSGLNDFTILYVSPRHFPGRSTGKHFFHITWPHIPPTRRLNRRMFDVLGGNSLSLPTT